MIAGYHLIWTAYGWWLPNDPRGSSSSSVRSAAIAGLGELHRGRKRIQPSSREVREFYEAAADVLRFPLLSFSAAEILALAAALEQTIRRREYTCYGCALMSDHVHLLIRRHRDRPESIIATLQDATRMEVLDLRSPDRSRNHPVWGGPGWKVYLDSRDDIERTIKYIQANPLKAGRPAQRWSFVREYDGWLPGGAANSRNRKRQRPAF